MEFLTSYFFIKAFITAVLAGVACGIVGVWVYLLNIPFVGVAMAHTAFAGAILGLLIGVDPVLLAMVLCIVSSCLSVLWLKKEIFRQICLWVFYFR